MPCVFLFPTSSVKGEGRKSSTYEPLFTFQVTCNSGIKLFTTFSSSVSICFPKRPVKLFLRQVLQHFLLGCSQWFLMSKSYCLPLHRQYRFVVLQRVLPDTTVQSLRGKSYVVVLTTGNSEYVLTLIRKHFTGVENHHNPRIMVSMMHNYLQRCSEASVRVVESPGNHCSVPLSSNRECNSRCITGVALLRRGIRKRMRQLILIGSGVNFTAYDGCPTLFGYERQR